MPASLRLALDATPLLGARTGVGVMTSRVLDGLAQHPDVDVVAYATTWRGRGQLPERAPARVRCVARPMPARPLHLAWRHSELPPIEWFTGSVDVVHGPNFVVPPARRAARVVTVHDLTAVHHPELCTAHTRTYPAALRRALAHGAWVHTVSDFVRGEILEHFDAVADRIPTTRLVIVGPDGWDGDRFEAALRAATHRDRIRRIGLVDKAARAALLRGATALAYPSVYEGFGLPPLEAMSVGLPVLATASGAVREVVGDAALLVPVGDDDALAEAIVRIDADDDLRAALSAKGPTHAGRYDWSQSVAGLVALYRKALLWS